ncbi:MAG: hypothetical protein ACJAX3_001445 [Patiriisocius sp.]|jgi:hypothetical protein
MKKKILLPTYFSKNARNALKYASELYKNGEVDFYLINSFIAQNYSLDNRMVSEQGEKCYEASKSRSKREFLKLQKRIELLKAPQNH